MPIESVSARLGHSSVAMTGDIYSHVFGDMDKEAADTFEEVLKKAKTKLILRSRNVLPAK